MISHTQSFQRLKDETQGVFDFAILVSYAVPFLKHGIKEAQTGGSPLPDHHLMTLRPDNFKRDKVSIGKVKSSAAKYKKEIAKTIRLAGFSYFEVYVGDVIEEILEFHATPKLHARVEASPKADALAAPALAAHSKLRERPKKASRSKYHASQAELVKCGFAFPSDRALIIGLDRMARQARDYKAADIPSMLTDILGLELTKKELDAYAGIREARNRIAHGRPAQSDLVIRTAIEANHKLRELARKIDLHVLQYWLIADPVSLSYASL